MTKQLASERGSAEQEKQRSKEEAGHRSGESKKLALELSKLKVGLRGLLPPSLPRSLSLPSLLPTLPSFLLESIALSDFVRGAGL